MLLCFEETCSSTAVCSYSVFSCCVSSFAIESFPELSQCQTQVRFVLKTSVGLGCFGLSRVWGRGIGIRVKRCVGGGFRVLRSTLSVVLATWPLSCGGMLSSENLSS